MEKFNTLSGKKILLGVSGSIAAYKAADILRRLAERGAEVHVAMTKHAARFVSRLTFETLSGFPVLEDEFLVHDQTAIGHIEISRDLDAALVAPATANIIGKLASGIADDSLTSALMAAACPLVIAPAMNDRMYANPVLQRNMNILRGLGARFVEPGCGALACGVSGPGRLADTEAILREVSALFFPKDLAGRTVLVTAGPTREYIDAVRFISNPSTGKMGFALAEAARERGADVVLICGPTHLAPPSGVRLVPVVSAKDMHEAVVREAAGSDVVIMAAAVSDFKPQTRSDLKIKKDQASTVLELERTADILQELGRADDKPLLVGFAAETDDIDQNALKKLHAKNLDLIVVNDLRKEGSGFGTDTNAVSIIDRKGAKQDLPTLPKLEIARHIVSSITGFFHQKIVSDPSSPRPCSQSVWPNIRLTAP